MVRVGQKPSSHAEFVCRRADVVSTNAQWSFIPSSFHFQLEVSQSFLGEADSRAASSEIPAFHTAPKLITASKQPANGPSLMSIERSPLAHMLSLYVFNLLINDLLFQYLSPWLNKQTN